MAHAARPDPQKYRGGSTSRLYKEDLQAWEDAHAGLDVGAPGEEEVVSLASSFDEPLVDLSGDLSGLDIDYTNLDLSSLNDMFGQPSVIPDDSPQYTGGTLDEDLTPTWWPKYTSGVYQGQHYHWNDLTAEQQDKALEYYDWANSFLEAASDRDWETNY